MSNRDELSHGELLDFVKGKFSFDTDGATGKTFDHFRFYPVILCPKIFEQ